MAIYAKIDNIKGSVSTQDYKGCIDIHNYTLEYYRNASQLNGQDGSRNIGTNQRTPVIFTKSMDNASTDLFEAYSKAKNISELTFYHIVDSSNKCYQRVIFKDVQIDRYSKHASAHGVLEEIEFSFMQQEMRISPIDAMGKVLPATSAGYNFTKMISI